MGIFISGTDTECGKTAVACALINAASQSGLDVLGMKPIASGSQRRDGVLENEDVERILAANGRAGAAPETEQWVNQFMFEPPIAPHIAAAQTGNAIDVEVIGEAYTRLAERCEHVIVEGVGGWRIPLNEGDFLAELPRRLGLPVLLVVGVKLGCINHALLSASAIGDDGLELRGWVANEIEPDTQVKDDIITTLRTHIEAPMIARIGHNACDASAFSERDLKWVLSS
ncbi:MAG: dethiobiotin synthase [Pseudomonadota bacterium]